MAPTASAADSNKYRGGGGLTGVIPMSATSGWETAISAGGIATQDAATITNPSTQIGATAQILRRGGKGTLLVVRLQYDDGLSSITDPVIKVFGRTGTDAWEVLKTIASTPALTYTVATNASDTTDGTDKFSIPSYANAFDCLGCEEIVIGVETALAGTGTTSTAVLQAKFI
jgi:hypothetical protein